MSLLASCRVALHRSRKTGWAGRRHSPRRGFSWSNRHESDPAPGYLAPFCARGMLMCPDEGGIEQQVFQVWISAQGFQNTLPHASFAPPVVALKNRVPVAEALGQIAPRSPRLCDPKHCIDEETIVFGSPPRVMLLTRQMGADLFPLLIRKFVSPHCSLLHELSAAAMLAFFLFCR